MKFLFLLCFIFFGYSLTYAQSSTEQKNEVQLAHDLKGKKEEFTPTKNGHFQAKLYTIEKPTANKTHHWFLQLIDKEDQFINIGNISLDAYHESDKNLKLNYIAPVFAMCNEGKYIIGFVNEEKTGKWILDIAIDNFNLSDTITLEIEVAEN